MTEIPDKLPSSKRLIVVGDRVLIEPEDEKTTSVGLLLPQGAVDGKQVRTGRVIATGPGTPLPDLTGDDEPWKTTRSEGRHLPMQARPGDTALFFRRAAVDITWEGTDYVIVPEASILILVREDVPGEVEEEDF